MCKVNYYFYFYVKKYLMIKYVFFCNYEISIYLDFN